MTAQPTWYSTDNIEDFALDPVERAVMDIAAGGPSWSWTTRTARTRAIS